MNKNEKYVIEIHNLNKSFNGVRAINNLNLGVQRGEILALLGPNGAGKTSTINCLLGLTKPDSGSTAIDGYCSQQSSQQARAALAYIPEQVALYPRLSGLENLAFMTRLSGLHYSSQELYTFLQTAGLPLIAANKAVTFYSKGMRQKVGIAIAVAKQAKALILDEPTSGLDPTASYEFSILLQALAATGVAILMATHDLFRAQDVADSVAIVKAGEVVERLSGIALKNSRLEQVYLSHTQRVAQCAG